MKIDLNVLKQLGATYGVQSTTQTEAAVQLIKSGNFDKAPAKYEPIITGAGYEWNDESNSYILEDQSLYYLSEHNLFLWVWQNQLIRGLHGSETLQKWVRGDEKYPEGKAKKFMETYKQMVGEGDNSSFEVPIKHIPSRDIGGGDINITETGVRNGYKEPDPTDALIAQLTKKIGLRKTLPSDDIINIGLKAKKENNEKLLAFLKTIKPLGENVIKKNELTELLHTIVKKIVKEIKIKEETGTAAVAPVTGPKAFEKKEEDPIEEMTTTMGGTPGYNVPGAFSKKGGSKAGIAGSAALGYELTPTGKKEMQRSADKLLGENKKKK